MTIIHIRDDNTGEFLKIDTQNPAGVLNVVDENTGELVQLNLSEVFSGILNVTDSNTGESVSIDYLNIVGTLSITDANTGKIIQVDLNNPSGNVYMIDADTGKFVLLDLSTFIPVDRFTVIPIGSGANTTYYLIDLDSQFIVDSDGIQLQESI